MKQFMREVLADFMGLFYGEERDYSGREMLGFYAILTVVLAVLVLLLAIWR